MLLGGSGRLRKQVSNGKVAGAITCLIGGITYRHIHQVHLTSRHSEAKVVYGTVLKKPR